MLKTFMMMMGLLSSVNAAVEVSASDTCLSVNLVVKHLDNKFLKSHVLSLSEISAAVQEVFPEIDSDRGRELQIDIGMHYLNR